MDVDVDQPCPESNELNSATGNETDAPLQLYRNLHFDHALDEVPEVPADLDMEQSDHNVLQESRAGIGNCRSDDVEQGGLSGLHQKTKLAYQNCQHPKKDFVRNWMVTCFQDHRLP